MTDIQQIRIVGEIGNLILVATSSEDEIWTDFAVMRDETGEN